MHILHEEWPITSYYLPLLLLSATTNMEYYKWLVTGEIRYGVYHTEYVSL